MSTKESQSEKLSALSATEAWVLDSQGQRVNVQTTAVQDFGITWNGNDGRVDYRGTPNVTGVTAFFFHQGTSTAFTTVTVKVRGSANCNHPTARINTQIAMPPAGQQSNIVLDNPGLPGWRLRVEVRRK